MSPSETLPIRSAARSWPRTKIWSVVLRPMRDLIFFARPPPFIPLPWGGREPSLLVSFYCPPRRSRTPGRAGRGPAKSRSDCLLPLDPHDGAHATPDDRHRLAGERRVDELALGARFDLHRFLALGVDELDPNVAGAAEVHALLVRALTEKRWGDVTDAHHLGDRDAKHALDVIPDGGNSSAWLAARDNVGQRDRARLGLGLLQPVGEVLREGRGRQQRVGQAGAKTE